MKKLNFWCCFIFSFSLICRDPYYLLDKGYVEYPVIYELNSSTIDRLKKFQPVHWLAIQHCTEKKLFSVESMDVFLFKNYLPLVYDKLIKAQKEGRLYLVWVFKEGSFGLISDAVLKEYRQSLDLSSVEIPK